MQFGCRPKGPGAGSYCSAGAVAVDRWKLIGSKSLPCVFRSHEFLSLSALVSVQHRRAPAWQKPYT